jgi:serine O-acetyltransferase
MSEIKSRFKADLKKYYGIELGTVNPGLLRKIRLFIVHFGLHCVILYRYGKFAKRLYSRSKILGVFFLVPYLILNYFCKMMHHVDICDADIGPGFYISHVGTILIGPITIGKNFSITHNITIGVGHRGGKAGIPLSIGDNVWIGTGSVISGDITVGNDVTISSGSIISRDLPDGCLAGGNPGRVILRIYDNRYLMGGEKKAIRESKV